MDKGLPTREKRSSDNDSLVIPSAPLPRIAAALRAQIEAAAIDANERYITDFLEEHAFCPFSKGGRAQGKTLRYVHYAESASIEPLVQLMARAALDPQRMVVQVILPMLEVDANEWISFCNKLTTVANKELGTGSDVYAVAAMHPRLSYEQSNPAAMIPLLRRSPDPTIQWVRLDDLEALYAGRSGETRVVDLDDPATLMQDEEQTPLFERITEANLEMAEKLGFAKVEEALTDFAGTLRKRYQAILRGDAS